VDGFRLLEAGNNIQKNQAMAKGGIDYYVDLEFRPATLIRAYSFVNQKGSIEILMITKIYKRR